MTVKGISYFSGSLAYALLPTAGPWYAQDALALGAVFAATDSVATLQVLDRDRQPLLFGLVFGEGMINDATSVVLLSAVAGAHARMPWAHSGPTEDVMIT